MFVNNIAFMVHEFVKDKNVEPNTILMSEDKLREFRKDLNFTMYNLHRDLENPNKFTFYGLDILIVQNKINFICLANI